MTVCVAIKVHDCIVFAADSAVSLSTTYPDGSSAVSNVWKHGLKVFNLHRDIPIVAMTAGLGNFGSMSISSIAKDLRTSLTENLHRDNYTIADAVEFTQSHFQEEYSRSHENVVPHHSFEFWIGGYGHDNSHGEIWKVVLQEGRWVEPIQISPPEASDQIIWGGQVQAISRLLLGYDHEVLRISGLSGNKFTELHTPLVHPSMPVQDTIDLADFLVDMTKRYVAFLPGADIVGGDTDIATVTRHEGFRWIRRKHYYPDHLNKRTTGHAT